ncbi:MAG: transaldolase family protein [Coriobacteriales bacterium]|nr:transaldolase family protein [Coriobacteriales bacterium]
MKFYLDTANLEQIEEVASWGVLAGVTTNPSLYAKEGGKLADFENHLKKIATMVDGPISGEVTAETADEMFEQGKKIAAIAPNMIVKVPMTVEGLKACKKLYDAGIDVNMTLVFSVPQAILAAQSGARYISPLVGRFDDNGQDGLEQLHNIIFAIDNYEFDHDVEIIAASIRSVNHVTQAALMGADIATIPYAILKKCVKHILTDQGLESFKRDWEKVTSA